MGDGKKVYDSEGVDQALTNLQTKGCTTIPDSGIIIFFRLSSAALEMKCLPIGGTVCADSHNGGQLTEGASK